MMRALRLAVALVGLLATIEYAPVYYSSMEFNDFVKEEALHTRKKAILTDALLSKARTYSLPVTANDIMITTNGSVFQVAVDYKVPVNLWLYNPELKFHANGSGLFRE